MNAKRFTDALSEIDDKYIDEALGYRGAKPQKSPVWVKWGAMAACLCLLIVGGAKLMQGGQSGGLPVPSPEMVQVANPILTVGSVEEMEKYLDFTVPVLDKEVSAYSVLIDGSYPTMGQINYADGSEFRIQYGSGDISGIYGGTLKESRVLDGVEVSYYQYTDADNATVTYALWEQRGFAFSYVYAAGRDAEDAEIETLIRQYQ